MRDPKPRSLSVFLLFLFVLLIPVVVGAQQRAPADTPVTLVAEDVQNLTVEGAKVWWWFVSPCAPTRAPAQDWLLEQIARTPTTGGLTRTVFEHEEPSPYCGDWAPEILSNVAADEEYLYWMSNDLDGLGRLSVEANPGDAPAPVYTGQSQADEIAERAGYLFLMDDAYGIVRVNKQTGAANTAVTAPQLGGTSSDLQVSDAFVYWNQSGFLKLGGHTGGGDGIANGVTGYIAEKSICGVGGHRCPSAEYVFLGVGEQIRRYDADADTIGGVLYDSPVSGAAVVEMTVDASRLYWIERRPDGCNPFCTYDYGLYRMSRSGGSAELLYSVADNLFGNADFDLTLGGPGNDYLFWHDNGALRRLPRDAAAIPAIDVVVTDVEVTQAIQDLNQSVDLIRDKRTGVRVYVTAAGQNVPGVSARLYRINSTGGILAGPIYPVANTNNMTVQNAPNRNTLEHAFYFELPNDWIDGNNVRLRADVNYNQIPPEPNFGNNSMSTAVLDLVASPTLRTHLVVWGYTAGGTYYEPRTVQDVWQARSWIRRAYPLASTPGGYESPDPGFRLKLRTINDPNLGGHVQRTSDFCLDIPAEDREFCAANYMNSCAKWLRATEGIPNDELIYSMIWDEPSLPFPRGRASGSVSSGPTGTGTWGWDNDGSYGDWYMGHEVGHNAGRNHPSQGNSCGHSASDPGFPYANAAIGNGNMWGFDVGDTGLNGSLTQRVYPNSTWRDMMSYCDNQWISDYTYEGIYDFLSTSRQPDEAPRAVRAGDAYLTLFGTVYDESDTAVFEVTGMWDSPGPYGLPAGGPYLLRLLDGGGSELATYNFDGEGYDDNPGMYSFGVVVPVPAGLAGVEIVREADGQLLVTKDISSSPPSIGNVELVGASDPVDGTVLLQWQAGDPDGDALMYDVYYTDDDGATYTAYALALSANSVELDTTQMGGSTQARFRVTANDGMRTAEAESATFTMANKPPSVTILTPEDGLEITYGTPVNFVGEVIDLQGHVPDGSMQWYLNGEATGVFGPYYTGYLLPVGTNQVTLRATNSAAQIGEGSVTVVVNDDLGYPGPTLAVGPDQIGWHLAADANAAQPAVLTISNVGTGSLSWTASEDVPWLSLGATSGDTPDTLTVTADPAAVAAGEPAETVITISGNNGQTVEIPVSLLLGVNPVWDPPQGQGPLYPVYLPLTMR